MEALAAITTWGAEHAAAAVITRDGVVARAGAVEHRFRLASVSKLLTAYATLIAVEEGSVALDEPAGRPGATVRHLLAHAAGYSFDGEVPVAPVGARRIYSNTSIEVVAAHVAERTGIPFVEYLGEAVFTPLGLDAQLRGSAAHGVWATVGALERFAGELLAPTLLAPETLAEALTVQFAGLSGVLPGFGRQDPLDWGLGFELRDGKQPHWTGSHNSPATFGHFGGAGTFLWVDPALGAGCAVLTDRDFGPWAAAAWPPFSDAVVGDLRPLPGTLSLC